MSVEIKIENFFKDALVMPGKRLAVEWPVHILNRLFASICLKRRSREQNLFKDSFCRVVRERFISNREEDVCAILAVHQQ